MLPYTTVIEETGRGNLTDWPSHNFFAPSKSLQASQSVAPCVRLGSFKQSLAMISVRSRVWKSYTWNSIVRMMAGVKSCTCSCYKLQNVDGYLQFQFQNQCQRLYQLTRNNSKQRIFSGMVLCKIKPVYLHLWLSLKWRGMHSATR